MRKKSIVLKNSEFKLKNFMKILNAANRAKRRVVMEGTFPICVDV